MTDQLMTVDGLAAKYKMSRSIIHKVLSSQNVPHMKLGNAFVVREADFLEPWEAYRSEVAIARRLSAQHASKARLENQAKKMQELKQPSNTEPPKQPEQTFPQMIDSIQRLSDMHLNALDRLNAAQRQVILLEKLLDWSVDFLAEAQRTGGVAFLKQREALALLLRSGNIQPKEPAKA